MMRTSQKAYNDFVRLGLPDHNTMTQNTANHDSMAESIGGITFACVVEYGKTYDCIANTRRFALYVASHVNARGTVLLTDSALN